MEYDLLKVLPGSTIDEAVEKLQNHHRPACIDFNGVRLYSDKTTLDSAYVDITGMTKANFDLQYN